MSSTGGSTKQRKVLHHVWAKIPKTSLRRVCSPRVACRVAQKSPMNLFGGLRDSSLWPEKFSWSEKGQVKAEHDVDHMARF